MKRSPIVWQPPAAVEIEYRAELKRFARELTRAVTNTVIPELEGIVEEANRFRPDSLRDVPDDGGWSGRLLRALKTVLNLLLGRSVDVMSYGERVNQHNKRQFQRMMRRAYGVDVFKRDPWLAAELHAWEAENLALIKSIPDQYLERLNGEILRAVRQGQSAKQVTALVRSTYNLPQSRAELIAVDQIGKLNGQLTQLRQQAIGVRKYTWRNVGDSRVRPDHVTREGMAFSWNDPPPDGHPGEPIRCRCWAEAILPELEDLDLS